MHSLALCKKRLAAEALLMLALTGRGGQEEKKRRNLQSCRLSPGPEQASSSRTGRRF